MLTTKGTLKDVFRQETNLVRTAETQKIPVLDQNRGYRLVNCS